MPTTRDYLAYYGRERARHFEAAGWLFAGNGGAFVACALFQQRLLAPLDALWVLSVAGFVAAAVFLACILIARRISRDPPPPGSAVLIGLTIGSFIAGLLALLAITVTVLVWTVMCW
jgi:hypothetical protein